MRLRNFLDFESKGLTRSERLSLMLHAARRAKERARSETESQELEFVCQDTQAALQIVPNVSSDDDLWLNRRIERNARVLKHYESFVVRFNRRYWWILFAVGLVLLVLAILYGSPSDPSLM